MTKYLILLLLLGTGCSIALQAQDIQFPDGDLQFEHLAKADGLPSDWSYRSIVQDRQGFLWAGSLNGLIRYDGYQIKTYRHNPLDTTSLSDNHVLALFEDRDGMLWAGTQEGGLNRFDPRAETFTRYQHDPDHAASLSSNSVTAILQTLDGTLWVGTERGLNRLDGRSVSGNGPKMANSPTAMFTHYRHNPDDERSLSHDYINALHEDRDGTLWVGTANWNNLTGGLNRFDPAADGFTRLRPGASASSVDIPVTAIGEDSTGRLYVGTCHSGLYRLVLSTAEGSDRPGERLEPLLPDERNPNQLHAPPGEASDLFCAAVSIIYEDRAGRLWVGTRGAGLHRYDPATQTLTRFRHDTDAPTSLSSDDVLSFYEDGQGTFWIGTWDTGVNKSVPAFSRFRVYGSAEIRANNGVGGLYEDAEGVLWIGTFSGQLFRFDPQAGAFARFSSPRPSPSGLWGSTIRSILIDQEGTRWVGQQQGLYRIDPQGETTVFRFEPVDPNSLINAIQFIEEDAEGTLWVGSLGGGLNRYDRHTGGFTRFLHDPGEETSLSDNRVFNLYQDRQGVLWFGTFGGGLNRFDPLAEAFTTYLDGTAVHGIYEDTAGRFWVATVTGGLYLMDRATGHYDQYTTKDGLPNMAVMGMTEDDQGLLWLTTPSGLTRFDPEAETFITYTEDDGLDNHATVPHAFLRSRSGAMFIGGTKGLTAFDPEAFTANPHPPSTLITRLRAFEDDVSLTGSQDAPITLTHNENELTFDYVGLHFLNPSRNRYAYRLEGYDTAWREAGPVRTATYTNLNPGPYTFRVKSANSDGVWDEDGTSLRVSILPPWWRTLWAYGLYGLLLLGGIFAADRIQRRRLIAREREKARERELEQARAIEKAHAELQETHTELEQSHQHLKTTQAQLVQQEKMASLGQLTAVPEHLLNGR